jgi:mannose-6-phosphate isomerase-like protein (cupin superfamily)
MRAGILAALAVVFVLSSSVMYSQSTAPVTDRATVVSREEIQAVLDGPGGGDRMVKHVNLDRYYLGVAILRRGATKPGQPNQGGISHTKVTEAYYVVSGSGTMVTGTEKDMKDIRTIAADSELYTTVVGPGFQGTFIKPAQSQVVKTGDVVIIPPGLFHGFSEVPDHIEYVTVRPDLDKVLKPGYVHPSIANMQKK